MWGCVLSELVITYLRLLKDCSLLLIVCFVLIGNFLRSSSFGFDLKKTHGVIICFIEWQSPGAKLIEAYLVLAASTHNIWV